MLDTGDAPRKAKPLLTPKQIYKILIPVLIKEPYLPPSKLIRIVKAETKKGMTETTASYYKRRIIDICFGSDEKQFNKLRSLLTKIQFTCPSFQYHIKTDKNKFISFCAVYENVLKSLYFYEKVIHLSSYELRSNLGGYLLCALICDGSNNICLLGYSICEKENEESWKDFIHFLKFKGLEFTSNNTTEGNDIPIPANPSSPPLNKEITTKGSKSKKGTTTVIEKMEIEEDDDDKENDDDDDDKFAFSSDYNNGVNEAVKSIYPTIEHIHSLYYVAYDFKSKLYNSSNNNNNTSASSTMPTSSSAPSTGGGILNESTASTFERIIELGKCKTKEEYDKLMEELEKKKYNSNHINTCLINYLKGVEGPWRRFEIKHKLYDKLYNKLIADYNLLLGKIPYIFIPLIPLYIHRFVTEGEKHREKLVKAWEHQVNDKIYNKICENSNDNVGLTAKKISEGKYEVNETMKSPKKVVNYITDLKKKYCNCGEYRYTGIPCKHACYCIAKYKYNVNDYCDKCYSKDNLLKTISIYPDIEIDYTDLPELELINPDWPKMKKRSINTLLY